MHKRPDFTSPATTPAGAPRDRGWCGRGKRQPHCVTALLTMPSHCPKPAERSESATSCALICQPQKPGTVPRLGASYRRRLPMMMSLEPAQSLKPLSLASTPHSLSHRRPMKIIRDMSASTAGHRRTYGVTTYQNQREGSATGHCFCF